MDTSLVDLQDLSALILALDEDSGFAAVGTDDIASCKATAASKARRGT